jgi:predicted RNA polymerase sigma factor
LHRLLPDEPEVTGLLALILLTSARSGSRVDAGGALVLLADQDRSRWDRARLDEGRSLDADQGGMSRLVTAVVMASGVSAAAGQPVMASRSPGER